VPILVATILFFLPLLLLVVEKAVEIIVQVTAGMVVLVVAVEVLAQE
jgi:hypothetical protein